MTHPPALPAGYYDAAACDLAAFVALTSQTLEPAQVPRAAQIVRNVPIYDMATLRADLVAPDTRRAVMAEWANGLRNGAGVIVLQGAYADTSVIDRATTVFDAIIAEEREAGAGKGDHFAASGANDRVWNALQKHALRDPEGFAHYFGNAAIAAACEAWLGPHYQMTAQVNQVRPGGKAQTAHRDYHLGFQSAAQAARFPAHVHDLTAALTLQGAIAHCDMPVDSGPTQLLPFSQQFGPGYLAFHDPRFRDHFDKAAIQIPLSKGDALFFNPALFHAAGENRSADINRMANLLQISSAFGRAMEAIDRCAMCRAVFPALRAMQQSEADSHDLHAAIAATAEGYAFPTNLDTDPPLNGAAPQTQADVLWAAMAEGWSEDTLATALADHAARRHP